MSRKGRTCGCGCGQPTSIAKVSNRRYGHIKGEPVTFVVGHRADSPGPQYVVNDRGCWVWQRRLNPDGYGIINATRSKPLLAHRGFYERVHGPVPAGLELDHVCRNRACVNPAHLEPVTHAENVRRGAKTKLDDGTIALICARPFEHYKAAASRFGVSPYHILKVRRERAHV